MLKTVVAKCGRVFVFPCILLISIGMTLACSSLLNVGNEASVFLFLLSVCVKFLSKFERGLQDSDRDDIDVLERKLVNACKNANGKDERFVSSAHYFVILLH